MFLVLLCVEIKNFWVLSVKEIRSLEKVCDRKGNFSARNISRISLLTLFRFRKSFRNFYTV